MWKKSGEKEVIWKVKSFRTDTRLISKKSILSVYYYRYYVLSKNIMYSSVLMCFQRTTTIIRVNPSKNNSTESQNLLEIPQIPPAINRISLPSQSTAPRRESLLLAANYYLSYFFFFSHSYRKPTILKRMCFFEPLF